MARAADLQLPNREPIDIERSNTVPVVREYIIFPDKKLIPIQSSPFRTSWVHLIFATAPISIAHLDPWDLVLPILLEI